MKYAPIKTESIPKVLEKYDTSEEVLEYVHQRLVWKYVAGGGSAEVPNLQDLEDALKTPRSSASSQAEEPLTAQASAMISKDQAQTETQELVDCTLYRVHRP